MTKNERRAWELTDKLVRVIAPAWLERVGVSGVALRALPPIGPEANAERFTQIHSATQTLHDAVSQVDKLVFAGDNHDERCMAGALEDVRDSGTQHVFDKALRIVRAAADSTRTHDGWPLVCGPLIGSAYDIAIRAAYVLRRSAR